MIVVTALMLNKPYFADSLDEAEALIDDVLSGNYWQNMTKLYMADRRAVDGFYPEHQFGLGTDRYGRFAAAHYVTDSGDGMVRQSLNPAPPADAPRIICDAESEIFFPASAVISHAAAKEAAMEYCRTGALPTNLIWQPCYWC
ncbi:hypothetical protein GCM10022247_04330 [Allokutzneria multivorans]|uniref:Immunity protein Imm1 n=1 Tax=Allokutzneria multivorans TaxID=1142134 RepID=A0ABP7QY67_9PSEU